MPARVESERYYRMAAMRGSVMLSGAPAAGADMKTLSGLDGLFLHLETPDTPMHVASLSVLELPKDHRGDFFANVRRLYARRLPTAPVLSRVLHEMPLNFANPVWVQADEVDLDYHLRRVVLPKPGTQAQLEACAAQLHSVPLDRRHPLWTATLIEGLPGGRVAYYFNIHHAVLDGQASVELAKLTFDLTPKPRRVSRSRETGGMASGGGEHPWQGALVADALRHDAGQYVKFAQLLPEITRTIARVRRAASAHAAGAAPAESHLFAPRTPLNVAIGRERSFAGVSLPLAEVHAIATAHQATVNDVVLAICAGALRRYLGRHGGVPAQALVAAIPMSLREGAATEFTTQATAARVSLATDIADPVRRLRAIRESAREAKASMGRMKSILPTDFPTFGVPWLLHGLASLYGQSRIANFVPPLFNLVVSNFRGPPMPLYIAGARMLQYWPMSIVGHGLGANVTVESYAGSLEFGVITASNAVRDPRRIADGLVAACEQLRRRRRR